MSVWRPFINSISDCAHVWFYFSYDYVLTTDFTISAFIFSILWLRLCTHLWFYHLCIQDQLLPIFLLHALMLIIYLFIHLSCAFTGIPKITLKVLHSSSRLQIFLWRISLLLQRWTWWQKIRGAFLIILILLCWDNNLKFDLPLVRGFDHVLICCSSHCFKSTQECHMIRKSMQHT